MVSYGYRRFKAAVYDLASVPGPPVGSPAVDFDALTLDGERRSLSDFLGAPIVLETGSVTCGRYVHGIERMNELAARHPRVRFIVLYVREAHPGSRIGQPQAIEEKVEHAQLLVRLEPERRLILVDDLDGTAHHAYGGHPNMAYVLFPDGTVALRSHCNCPARLEPVLERVLAGPPRSETLPG